LFIYCCYVSYCVIVRCAHRVCLYTIHVTYSITVILRDGKFGNFCRCHFKIAIGPYSCPWKGRIVSFTFHWWGFATSASADKDRIEAFVRRGVRLNLYQDTDPTASQLVDDFDDALFRTVLYNNHHHLLQNRTEHSYTLRPRRHDCSGCEL